VSLEGRSLRQVSQFKRCVYCGGLATTSDHTPPRCLLVRPLPSHAVTVPACEDCNNGFSRAESIFKLVLAHVGSHPKLREELGPGGSLHKALSRDEGLRALFKDFLDGDQLRLTGEVWTASCKVIVKTVQGLYRATFDRFVPANKLEIICLRNSKSFSLDELVNEVRPPQVLDITDEPLPEITPRGWARKGQVVAAQLLMMPEGGGEGSLIERVFWLKQDTPVEWIDYQPGIFRFGFVGTKDHRCICAIELWESLTIGVSAPWPSKRGSLRRGRNNPFSRDRAKTHHSEIKARTAK
jgi:hypothetical protein